MEEIKYCDNCGKSYYADELVFQHGVDEEWCKHCIMDSEVRGMYAAAIPYNKWPSAHFNYFRNTYLN